MDSLATDVLTEIKKQNNRLKMALIVSSILLIASNVIWFIKIG